MQPMNGTMNSTLTSNSEVLHQLRQQGAAWFAETIAAHGGNAFLTQRTLKMTGKGEFFTPPQTGNLRVPLSAFTYYVATEGRNRLEARSPGGPIRMVIRGNGLGGYALLAGRSFPLTTDVTDNLEPHEFLRRIARENLPVVAVRPEEPEEGSDGTPLLHVEVETGTNRFASLYISSDTRLLHKVIVSTSRGKMAVVLGDYTTVESRAVSQEIQLWEEDAPIMILHGSTIEIDNPIDPKLFE